jgi:hypothetical protein
MCSIGWDMVTLFILKSYIDLSSLGVHVSKAILTQLAERSPGPTCMYIYLFTIVLRALQLPEQLLFIAFDGN